jgi:2-dehydro-3-deoxy-D-arabinonate dehydratase
VGGEMRLAVVAGDKRELVDVTDPLDAASPGASGLAGAIRHARLAGASLGDFLTSLIARPSARVRFDSVAGGSLAIDGASPAPPVTAPEVWGAGVTYRRSREAREAESANSSNVYAQIYDAERPELFLKDSGGRRTVASGMSIAVRRESVSSIPEPELALILDADGRIVALTLANDVTARDLEALNPLYLPQAKIYDGACALGPVALIQSADREVPAVDIVLRIRGADGASVYEGATSTGALRRSFEELVWYLRRDNSIDDGTVLLTGTGIVPPEDFALEPGQVVEISSPLIGTLTNTVVRHPVTAPFNGQAPARVATPAEAQA